MRCNTAIGEAMASYGDRDYLIRPGFASLAAIGTPEEIDHVVRGCFSAYQSLTSGALPACGPLNCCTIMLAACSDLPDGFFGYSRESTRIPGRLVWTQGLITVNDLVVMANHCVKWGIIGNPKRKPSAKAKAEMGGLFDPAEFVAVAMMPSDSGGLGQPREEAWRMTMVEFQSACEARRDAVKGKKPEPIDAEKAQQLFDEHEKRLKARRSKG